MLLQISGVYITLILKMHFCMVFLKNLFSYNNLLALQKKKKKKINRALYGLKQALRAWFEQLLIFLLGLGFLSSKTDSSLLHWWYYYYWFKFFSSNTTYFLTRQRIFIKWPGQLHHFLSIEVLHTNDGLFLTQSRYTL